MDHVANYTPQKPYVLTKGDTDFRVILGKIYHFVVNPKTGRLSLVRAKAKIMDAAREQLKQP